jgi:ankyrin repeat protein
VAANTNNTETLARLLESGVADVNIGDEHQRTALHFAAAKVGFCEYSEYSIKGRP